MALGGPLGASWGPVANSWIGLLAVALLALLFGAVTALAPGWKPTAFSGTTLVPALRLQVMS